MSDDKTVETDRIKKTRVNLYLPEPLRLWVWEQANENGLNFTTMLQIMILDYKKQKEALDMTNALKALDMLKNDMLINK